MQPKDGQKTLLLLAQEQLEEVMQEVEELRVKCDALKADNSTLLVERASQPAGSPGAKAAVEPNGDTAGHRMPGAAATVPSPGTAELEVCNYGELEPCGVRCVCDGIHCSANSPSAERLLPVVTLPKHNSGQAPCFATVRVKGIIACAAGAHRRAGREC